MRDKDEYIFNHKAWLDARGFNQKYDITSYEGIAKYTSLQAFLSVKV